jgi:hypothetical protein
MTNRLLGMIMVLLIIIVLELSAGLALVASRP